VPAGAVAPLGTGDRVRLGHRVAESLRLVAVALDAQGEVTPLYPTSGEALAVAPGPAFTFLPESLEFTGSGDERIFVVITGAPLTAEQVASRVRQSFEHTGRRLAETQPRLEDGEQLFTWTFRKP
jgi:hypothetical protein